MTRVAIGLGSNLADRAEAMRGAVGDLSIAGSVVETSSVYQSEPVGGPPGQEAYLNAVCVIETNHDPITVLEMLQGIEERWGRRRDERWGPRTLDLDVLLFGDEVVATDRLRIPHPRMHERRFVLEPLAEVWPDAAVAGTPVAEALESVRHQAVERIAGPRWVAMRGRGGPWVAGQVVLLVLFIASLFDVGSLPMGAWAPWLGRGLVVVAAVLFLAGAKALGRNLTGFPEPTDGGTLVATGIFRWIRHPLYTANVLLILGVALHQRSLSGLIVAALAGGFFWLKAGHEEIRLSLRFPGYRAYMRSTMGRLVPGL